MLKTIIMFTCGKISLTAISADLRACLHEGEWPYAVGLHLFVVLPFFFVLGSSFHMQDRVPLGGIVPYLEARVPLNPCRVETSFVYISLCEMKESG